LLFESRPLRAVKEGFAAAWAISNGVRDAPRPSWISPEDPVAPADLELNDLFLWIGTIAPAVPLAAFTSKAGFDPTELEKLDALRREEDRAAYAAAHGALRLVLARFLHCEPGDVRFRQAPYGKPALCSETHSHAQDIHFSISHAAGLAALTLARFSVGVDIEATRWSDDLLDVARRNFAAEQLADLKACIGADRTRLFFRQWTLGEALIKATGMGLHQRLDGFAFTPEGVPRLVRLEPRWGRMEHWHFGLF